MRMLLVLPLIILVETGTSASPDLWARQSGAPPLICGASANSIVS